MIKKRSSILFNEKRGAPIFSFLLNLWIFAIPFIRLPGIEPGSQAWEARIIPLDHRRVFFGLVRTRDARAHYAKMRMRRRFLRVVKNRELKQSLH